LNLNFHKVINNNINLNNYSLIILNIDNEEINNITNINRNLNNIVSNTNINPNQINNNNNNNNITQVNEVTVVNTYERKRGGEEYYFQKYLPEFTKLQLVFLAKLLNY